MMVPERIIGIGLLILGVILIFRLLGLEAFQDKPVEEAPKEAAEDAPKEVAEDVAEDVAEEATPASIEPTAEDIDSAQDNSVGEGVKLATQEVASTEGPVSPAESSSVVTAPGIVRPAHAGSVRPSFPAAAGLDGEASGGPFEQYVKMLVRSELSSQGVPSAAAEGFQVAANAPLGEMISNATKRVQGSLHGVFAKKNELRVA